MTDRQRSRINARNMRAKRAPQPSGGRSNPDLTSHTKAQGAHGYVWRLNAPTRSPRNPETGKCYRARPARPGKRMSIEDLRTDTLQNW